MIRSLNSLCILAFLILFSAAPLSATTVIVDNSDPEFTILSGTWSTGSWVDPWGEDYRWASTTTGDPTHEVEWRPSLPASSLYEVAIWYVAGSNRADDAPFTIDYDGGSATIPVNQQARPLFFKLRCFHQVHFPDRIEI